MHARRRFKGFATFYKGFESFKSPVDTELLKRKRKHFLVGLLLSVVLIVNLSIWQMYRNINGPFLAMLEESKRKYGETGNLSLESNPEQLKASDTDSDGLNDYDEMYQYGTSAYLSDSDSDGLNDRAEIEQGSDPNCSTGEDCASYAPTSEQAFAKEPTSFQQDAADALRQSLIQSGMTEEELSQVSDEELLVFYQQFMIESNKQINAGGEGDEIAIPEEEQLNYLKQMTPEQLRGFLVAAGADQALIDAIQDDQLLDLYLETLSAVQDEVPLTDVPDSKEEVSKEWQEAIEE